MSDLNKDLIEQLLQRIDLLEKEMKHHKKKKMADKDYDKDGKVETSEEEYLGSRDRAIKKAKGEKIEEALDRIGGNVNNNSPSIRSLASKIEKSDLVEKVLNKLDEMNPMNKKLFKDQGTKIQLSENIIFGGFPKLVKEEKIPSEIMTALFQDNNPEEYQEFAKGHSPLPKDIHDDLKSLVGDEVNDFSTGDIDVNKYGESLKGHVGDLNKAISMLDKKGHGKHLIAQHLDTIRGRINDAISNSEYRKEIKYMRSSGRSSFS